MLASGLGVGVVAEGARERSGAVLALDVVAEATDQRGYRVLDHASNLGLVDAELAGDGVQGLVVDLGHDVVGDGHANLRGRCGPNVVAAQGR